MDILEREIIQLVCKQTGLSMSRVGLESRLFHDLGVDGADGWEIIEEAANKYNIDISEVKMENYFGPEAAATPLTLIRWLTSPAFRRGDKFTPIHVRDLVACVRAGKWLL
jgi:acyl carrier protein